MAKYISQSAFAKQCGVSRQAIGKAAAEGRVVLVNKRVDPDNPSNQYFRAKAEDRKALRTRPKKSKKAKVVTNAPPETPADIEEEVEVAEGGPRPKSGGKQTFDTFQKVYEETRLKKIQADTAVLKYAENIGAVVDTETLNRKLGAFANFLFTRLVYLPENIAADLWMTARADDDPERKIREILSDQIEELIKEAKKAAAEVLPPDHGIKYIMLGLEEEE